MRVTVPGSKSMTQRALIIGALTPGMPVTVRGYLDCDDSRTLTAALGDLGVLIERQPDVLRLAAPARLVAPDRALDCSNAGTTVRFLCGLAPLVAGRLWIDGDSRMRERPIAPLIEALEALSITVEYQQRQAHLPLRLARTREVPRSACVTVDASLSSQFASALLLAAPRLPGGLDVSLRGSRVSRSYVTMTAAMMRAAGAEVTCADGDHLRVAPGVYRQPVIAVEPDWSSAAFVLGAAELLGLHVDIEGLEDRSRSLQGDAIFAEHLAELRRPRAHAIDLTDAPDLIAPLCALALFATHDTVLSGIAHARVKESDRPHVLARELSRIGARIIERVDALVVTPLGAAAASEPLTLMPDGDHRMAMAFALVALRRPDIVVGQPGCVSKSFPGFFDVLGRLCDAAKVAPPTRCSA